MAIWDILKRAGEATQYTIRGVIPSTWMSPLNPLVPSAPVTPARQFDYNVGYNVFYTPRGTQRYSFAQLRNASRNSQLIRMAIETRLDQMDALEWKVVPVDEKKTSPDDKRIALITEFLQSPDRVHDWAGWLRMALEELLVTDALTIVPRKDMSGGLYSLEIIDGSTIFPLIDSDGRQPMPPSPAFQQILKGVPKADFTSDELIYAVRKTQVNTPYGYSVVEQVIESAYTDIERAKYQLAYFTDGSVPDAYVTAPDGMTPDKVAAYQEQLNSLLEGNYAQRRKMPVLIHGMTVDQLKEPPLTSEFDEWLVRKICFAFSLPPTPFVKMNNRATAENQKESSIQEGLMPLQRHVERLMNRFIRFGFASPDLKFQWDEEEEIDPVSAAEIDVRLTESGIIAINEVRNDRGLEPIEGGDVPMVKTGSGYVPIDPKEANKLKLELQPKIDPFADHSGKKPGEKRPEGEPDPKKPDVKKKPTVAKNIYATN